jgi:hypothetical protein
MMGLPCLRREGAFFAAWDRGTGALLVKLAPTRVDELLAAGPFAPAGRRFRQWSRCRCSGSGAGPGCFTKRWSSRAGR